MECSVCEAASSMHCFINHSSLEKCIPFLLQKLKGYCHIICFNSLPSPLFWGLLQVFYNPLRYTAHSPSHPVILVSVLSSHTLSLTINHLLTLSTHTRADTHTHTARLCFAVISRLIWLPPFYRIHSITACRKECL